MLGELYSLTESNLSSLFYTVSNISDTFDIMVALALSTLSSISLTISSLTQLYTFLSTTRVRLEAVDVLLILESWPIVSSVDS